MFCTHCRTELPETAFLRANILKRDICCRECNKVRQKRWRDANVERVRVAARLRMRAWRARNQHTKPKPSAEAQERERQRSRRYAANNREKKRAHLAVNYAIKSGKLVRMPCEKCNSKNAHAHHDNYTKPLAVRWLCPTHHIREHRWIA
jgi:hypothetical protein